MTSSPAHVSGILPLSPVCPLYLVPCAPHPFPSLARRAQKTARTLCLVMPGAPCAAFLLTFACLLFSLISIFRRRTAFFSCLLPTVHVITKKEKQTLTSYTSQQLLLHLSEKMIQKKSRPFVIFLYSFLDSFSGLPDRPRFFAKPAPFIPVPSTMYWTAGLHWVWLHTNRGTS